MERSSDSQNQKKKKKKKIIDQILSYISFYFEICAHLAHLFAQTPKIMKLLIDNLFQKMSQTQSRFIYLWCKSVFA